MIFKKKTMSRDEWIGIDEKTCADMPVENEWFSGRAGLLYMKRVARPFSVNVFDRHVRITAEGYTWLQIAPENENYWATVMFDEEGKLFECYFDITKENHLLEDGKSWFYDMILDILMTPGGQMTRLDNAELDEALERGEIGQNEYDFAVNQQNLLIKKLSGHEKEFFEMCSKLRKTLLERME